MSAEHFSQSIKGDLLGSLQHLEEVADHIRSAQKTFEALPSASHNSDYATAQKVWSEWLKYREDEHGVSFPEWLQVRLNAEHCA